MMNAHVQRADVQCQISAYMRRMRCYAAMEFATRLFIHCHSSILRMALGWLTIVCTCTSASAMIFLLYLQILGAQNGLVWVIVPYLRHCSMIIALYKLLSLANPGFWSIDIYRYI